MVKIAIAGPGQVAHEIIDGLVATGKHDIILLSRRDATAAQTIEGTTWVKVDYSDPKSLVQALQGVHTVLSFMVVHQDINCASQKALIDAAIEAGVRRIAPSEWGPANVKHLHFYDNKLEIRKYLKEKNKNGKVIEYTLFQPGWFMNYLSGARRTAKYVQAEPLLLVDHDQMRGRYAGSPAASTTYTLIDDVVNIVVRAVDYEGEWPEVGGINGQTLSIGEEIAIGEKVRGQKYQIEQLDVDEVRGGVVNTSWFAVIEHPSLSESERQELSKELVRKSMLNLADGAATASDEWNRIFPDYKFKTVEDFLVKTFADA